MATLTTQPESINRTSSERFTVIGKVFKVAVRILAVLIIGLFLIASIYLLGKVGTGAGSMPRWRVGQVWARNFFEMPGICKTGYGLGLISIPLAAVGEPISELLAGEISWSEVPARSVMIIKEFFELRKDGFGICPALFPSPKSLTEKDFSP